MRKAQTDAEFIRGIEEASSGLKFGRRFKDKERGEGNSGEADGGDTDGGLYAADSGNFGGADPGDSVSETAKPKRGRPKGSANVAGSTAGNDRRKLADTLTGAVGFGVSYYGSRRASKYKQFSVPLAVEIYQCYQITPEQASSIGQPLADTFCAWFPAYVKSASKSIDPGLAIARMFTLLQQLSENEKLIVARHTQRMHGTPNNGNSEESAHSQWMNENAPAPDEIS